VLRGTVVVVVKTAVVVVVVVVLLVVDVMSVSFVVGLDISDAPPQAEAQNVRKNKNKILFTVQLLILFCGP
tara:strand:- start:3296 stop:3508 length:213 start_codon:yes stop_codon:yes gene_type:complete